MHTQAETYMNEAIRLASQNMDSGNGGPFGCVIVKDGIIIASAFNEVIANNDPTAHAEIVAIRRACSALGTYQLDGCEIYTSCEPCPMCLGAIYWSRPARVFYAASRHDAHKAEFDDHKIYQEFNLTENQRSIPFIQVMQEQARDLFRQWIEKNPDIRY